MSARPACCCRCGARCCSSAGLPLFWVALLAGRRRRAGLCRLCDLPACASPRGSSISATADIGYQAGLALKAFAHGGFAGVGPGAGTIKYRIPDAHSDYIFAVAGEEFGLVLCGVIAVLFCLLTVRLLLRAANARDPFCQLAGAGLAVVTAVQAFINMGVAVSLLPAKGMTLPFISYGGSSLFAVALTMGFALAVTRQRPKLDCTRDDPCLASWGAGMSVPSCFRPAAPAGICFPAQALAGELVAARPRDRGDDRCALRQLRHRLSRRADRDRAVLAASTPSPRRSRSRPASPWPSPSCCG